MKKLFLILLLLTTVSIKADSYPKNDFENVLEDRGYIVFLNEGYDDIEVILYFNQNGRWRVVATSYIPGGYSASFPIGNYHCSQYGYSTDRDKTIRHIYSDEISLF